MIAITPVILIITLAPEKNFDMIQNKELQRIDLNENKLNNSQHNDTSISSF